MNDVLADVMRTEVYDRLDYLDRLAIEADLRSRAALAETEIARMTAAWRALLALHQPDEYGRCPHCSRWRRPYRFPCPVWKTAREHLVAVSGADHRVHV